MIDHRPRERLRKRERERERNKEGGVKERGCKGSADERQRTKERQTPINHGPSLAATAAITLCITRTSCMVPLSLAFFQMTLRGCRHDC